MSKGIKVKIKQGEKYGYLRAISLDGGSHPYRGVWWRFLCERCGQETVKRASLVAGGKTTSCGCGKGNIKHSMRHTAEYRAWTHMRDRCYSRNDNSYHHYGGRGIEVCARWKDSFDNFYKDMGDRPKGMSLDRTDNNGNYEPGNCRWATKSQQSNNTRRNVNLTIDGTTKTIQEWSLISGVRYATIWARHRKGMPAHDAIFRSVKKHS